MCCFFSFVHPALLPPFLPPAAVKRNLKNEVVFLVLQGADKDAFDE